jgi:hypothetical protein
MTINLSLGLLFAVVIAELLWLGLGEDEWRQHRSLAAACLIAAPLTWVELYNVAFEGLSPDLVLYCCGIEALVLMLRLGSASLDEDRQIQLFVLIVLAAAGCAAKPSFVVVAAGAVGWAWTGPRLDTRATAVAGAVAALLFGTSIVRGVVLSGYPFFPAPILPISVPWRLPLETARQMFGWIRAWARLVEDTSMRVPYETVLSNWSWLRPWARELLRKRWEVVVPLLFSALALAPLSVWWPKRSRVFRRHAMMLVVLAAALVYWFLAAPDLRFAGALFVMLAMTA